MDNFFSNLNSFINEKCWNATFSYSAQILFLDFGYALKEDLGSFGYCYSGQYSIHLDCQWRLDDDNVSLCGYDDPQEAIAYSATCLEGATLSDFEILLPFGDAIFTFSSGKKLKVFYGRNQ